jgi:hypothetical protein
MPIEMATTNATTEEIAVVEKIPINGHLVQFIDRQASKWLEQKEPTFNAAVLIAMHAAEDYSKKIDLELAGVQKHELAVDLIDVVLNNFARYKPGFVDILPAMKDKLADRSFVDELIDAAITVSSDPNTLNTRWKTKKNRNLSCFGK